MEWIGRWRRRLRNVLRGRHAERVLDAEMRHHIESEIEHRVRLGMAPGDARRTALVDFGGVERYKDEARDARGTRWIDDLVADTLFAVRSLRRRPGFAAVAILTLAIGIGGTTAVFSAVDAVLLQPLPYQQPGRLVRLYQFFRGQTDARNFVTPVHFLAYRTEMGSFEAAAAIDNYSEAGADIGRGDDVRRIRLLPVSSDYFNVVRVQPALGRGFRPSEEIGIGKEDDEGRPAAAVVVLSHDLWKSQFRGDPAALGQVLTMSAVPYTVIGVMPPGFVDPVVGRADAWIPVNLTPGRNVAGNANNHYLTVLARLRPGATLASAQAELDALGRSLVQQYPPEARNIRARLVALKEDIVGPASKALQIMLGAVALVLLLVCVNVANLLLVRGSERARELALRSTLGAGRPRIVRQLLTESMLLALAGGLAGLVVARLAMQAIVTLGAGSIPRLDRLALDPALLGFSLGVASLSAILFGTIPALRAARVDPGDVLREQSRSATGGAGHARLRIGLVVTQVAVAFILLAGAGVLLASFTRLRDLSLGFKTDNVLTFELNLPAARYDSTARARFYEEFAQRVERLPGVRVAGGVSKLPGTGAYHSWGVQVETGPKVGAKDVNFEAENRVVSGDYFRALGIPVLAGRIFDARDDAAAPSRLVVSKSAGDRFFPGIDPVGQTMTAGRDHQAVIIGVVADAAVDVEGTLAPTIYHAHRKFAGERLWALTQVVATNGPPERVQAEIRDLLSAMDPALVMYRPAALADVVGRGTAQRLFTLRLLGGFAIVALGLAALGLFGVLSYTVTLRGREFGIRMALGADAGSIAALVLRQGMAVSGAGIALGLAGAVAASRVMGSLVFRTSPLDPRVLGGAVIFMAAVACVAAYLPAHRATAADPLDALRSE